MTDCVHCENPAEVCRGCYERLRQEANDRANERLDSQYVALVRQQALTASVTERLMLAEQERDRLRAELEQERAKRDVRSVLLDAEIEAIGVRFEDGCATPDDLRAVFNSHSQLLAKVNDLQWKHLGQKKAIELLQKGFESTCEQHDALKQSSRATAAECERLRKQIEQQAAAYDKLHEAHKETVAECGRLRAQVARLRKALVPLARLAAVFPHHSDSDEVIVFVSELRAAAKALEETTQPPSE